MSEMVIGFIGLGLMGEPMSTNLVKKSGHPVLVYDVDSSAGEETIRAGAVRQENPETLARQCNVLFSMLPNDKALLDTGQRIFEKLHPGTIWADMSTVSPDTAHVLSKQLTRKNCCFLDTPVVKSRTAAISGELGIYVGGNVDMYRKIMPLLLCMGKNIQYIGSSGSGLIMKLCHNLLVAQIQNGVNEAMSLAMKLTGVRPTEFANAISLGGGQNFYLESKAASIESGDFRTAFSIANMYKDLCLVQTLSAQAELSLDGLETVWQIYDYMIKQQCGAEDFSATWKLFAG